MTSLSRFISCLVIMSAANSMIGSDSLMLVQGESLFVQNCKACHQLDQRMVGPALSGVTDRRSEEWLFKLIRSSQSMIASGDSAAVALFNEYNQVPMPDQNLSDEEIGGLLAYIRSGGTKVTTESGIPRPDVSYAGPFMKPPRFGDFRFWILYTVTVVLVIVSIYYKAELIALKKQVQPEEES